jgi:predicted CoA-binding protein
MAALREAVDDFLAQKRLAVAGVSRSTDQPANLIYRKLKAAGYEVYPTNPNATEVEGDPCYPDLKSVPVPLDGVVVATAPEVTEQVVRECAALGVGRVWMHRSFGQGSVSEPAVRYCQEHGIAVIPGGCPMMFCEPVDPGHTCIRWLAKVTGRLPAPA